MISEIATYRQLADSLQSLIEDGTWRAGDRLPSLRQLARDHRVSVTTALSAYQLLENRGLIEARTRSGFFVLPRIAPAERLPGTPKVSPLPRDVSRPGIYERIITAINDPSIVPLGAAVPSDEAIPFKRLASLATAMLRKHGPTAFHYSPNPGLTPTRHQVAKRLLTAGTVVSHHEVIITSGATEALSVALAAVTRPGDLVAVEMPTYFGILHIVEDLGLKVVEIPVSPTDGMDLDRLEEAAAEHPLSACVVQPNFQNPTGGVMSPGDRSRLVKLAERHDFVIVEDDHYGELAFDGSRPGSLLAHDRHDRVIHCAGVSKSLAPGLRVGWIVARGHREAILKAKNARFAFNPTLFEFTVAAFFADGGYDRHLRRIRLLYRDQVLRTREAVFRAFPDGTKVNSPGGGFLLWVQLPRGFDSERLATEALDRGISVVPGTIFTASGGLQNCLRLSCGSAFTPRIQEAIQTLGKLLAAQASAPVGRPS